MKICAIIAEFNPLHNGHQHIINYAKNRSDALVVIMSGNYVQRGGAAVFDKFSRGKIAVARGADLVVELPAAYSLSPAELFARGAVETLDALGCVDELVFGSEYGDIGALCALARCLSNETPEFKAALRRFLDEGCSLPAAREMAVAALYPELSGIIKSPNNILGIEYIKALTALSSPIAPVTAPLLRGETVLSASAIREILRMDGSVSAFLPEYALPKPVFDRDFEPLILGRLLSLDKDAPPLCPDGGGELWARVLAARNKNTLETIIETAKSRRLTKSRVKRLLFNLLIANPFTDFRPPEYIRVLAQNSAGANVLSLAKKTARLPVASRAGAIKDFPLFRLEQRATDIYNLARGLPAGEEFQNPPRPVK